MMAVLNFLFIFTIVLWEKPEKQTPETGRLLVREIVRTDFVNMSNRLRQ